MGVVTLHPVAGIPTDTGFLYPYWRDWDPWHGGYAPAMVYASTLAPGSAKGPFAHLRRQTYLVATSGRVWLTWWEERLREAALFVTPGALVVARIPPRVPFAVANRHPAQEAALTNLTDIAWRPGEAPEKRAFAGWEQAVAWRRGEGG